MTKRRRISAFLTVYQLSGTQLYLCSGAKYRVAYEFCYRTKVSRLPNAWVYLLQGNGYPQTFVLAHMWLNLAAAGHFPAIVRFQAAMAVGPDVAVIVFGDHTGEP